MIPKIHFLIIDNDFISNALCEICIRKFVSNSVVRTYSNPKDAFNFIKANVPESRHIILLDINMPQMSGWEFLNLFETLDSDVKKKFSIYMMSSSVDPRDQAKANSSKVVKQYIVKPLTQDHLRDIV